MHSPLTQPPVTHSPSPQAPNPHTASPSGAVVLTPLLAAQLIGLGVLLATVIIGLFLLLLRKPEPQPIVLHPPSPPEPTATPLPTATPSPLTVFVSGGVAQPGLYTLAWNARVGDALAAAGGLQEGVDGARVNQAERLFDGAQVHVPEVEEAETSSAATQGGPPPGLSGTITLAAPVGGSASGLVNLNTASAEGLMTLPGIGPSKAAAIIANRPYQSVDDLDRVPGFGEKTIDQLRDFVTTQ